MSTAARSGAVNAMCVSRKPSPSVVAADPERRHRRDAVADGVADLHDPAPPSGAEHGVVEGGAALDVGALDGDVSEHARSLPGTGRVPGPFASLAQMSSVAARDHWLVDDRHLCHRVRHTRPGHRHLCRRALGQPVGPDSRGGVPRANLRPVLVTSRLQDPVQKIRWVDDHWTAVEGAQASVELVDGQHLPGHLAAQRGLGAGCDFGWSVITGLATPDIAARRARAVPACRPGTSTSRAGDIGFWQAAIRERERPRLRWL